MSCERFERALIDHACGAPIPMQAAAHIEACPACQARLDGERRLVEGVQEAIRRELRIAASPGFSARVSARARAIPPAGTAIDRRWVAAAACAVLIFGVYASVSMQRDAAPPIPVQPPSASSAPIAPVEPVVTVEPPGAAEPVTMSRPPAPRRVARTVRRAADSVDAPPREVLAPPTQLLAIARLRELVETGAIDEETLPPQIELGTPPAHLVIRPLVVPEIIIPDVEVVSGAAALRTPDDSEESL